MAEKQQSRTGRLYFKSLTFEVSALIVLIVFLVLAVISVAFVTAQRNRIGDGIVANSRAFANLAAESIDGNYAKYYGSPKAEDFQTFEAQIGNILAQSSETNRVQLLKTDGTVLFDSNELTKGKYEGKTRTVSDQAVVSGLKQKAPTMSDLPPGGTEDLQIIVPVDSANRDTHYVRFFVARVAAVSARLDQVYQRLALLCLVMLLLVVVAAVLIASRITRPVKSLTAVTQKISNGDLTQRVPLTVDNEYGQLGLSFNSMADKLQQVYEGLEKRVEEKTRQLAQKVEEVEAEKVKDDALLSSIGEGMVAVDADGRVAKINAPAIGMLGVREEDIVGHKISETIAFKDEAEKPVPPETLPGFLALHHGQKTEETYKITHPDTRKIIIAVTSSPVRLQHRTVGVIMVIRDVTKEREVDRMKTEFISLASHQLRTPLSAIRWFSEMLGSGDAGALNPEQQEFTKNIADSTDRMIQLVSSLLNISRMESGRIIVDPKPTNLKDLVAGIVSDLHAKIAEREQHLAISVHEGLDKVNLDPRLIGQVYLNLLTNAIKYTPKGGDITVIISRKDDLIISQVSDNGYGIPKEQQPRMFQKFFRADNVAKIETDGTGLGMYLVKAVVESSGGKIWFESEEGKGTTFWFSLPATGMKAKAGEVTLDS